MMKLNSTAKTVTMTDMDIARYDQQTQQLLRDCLQQLSVISKKAPATIRKLMERAETLDDDAVRGFALYHRALYIYYTQGDNKKYRPVLNRAMRCLLRADERTLLSRAYNFIAVDAHNNGLFDIAYNYYMTALRMTDRNDPNNVAALIETNIGRLYSELSDHVSARRYIRKGMSAIRKQKDAPRYAVNYLIILVNDAITSLALSDIPSAEKSMRQIERILKIADEEALAESILPRLFLEIRYALALGDKRTVRRSAGRLAELLKKEPLLTEFIDDLRSLGLALLDARLLPPLSLVIDAVNDRIMSCDVTHVMRIFSEIKVDYYSAAKNRQKLTDALYEQHLLLIRQREEQLRMFRYSVDLINLVNDLLDERERMQQENTVLQVRVQTDTLTGIHNRYMMNKELEAAFERAYAGRHTLGVGIIDIDYFKEYNDTYGHQAGDRCLIRIAKQLQKFADASGFFCARYGGDEFVILYENKTDKEILRAANRLNRQIEKLGISHKTSGVSSLVTISQGITNRVPVQKNKVFDYLTEADEALYRIKKGRGSKKSSASCLLTN